LILAQGAVSEGETALFSGGQRAVYGGRTSGTFRNPMGDPSLRKKAAIIGPGAVRRISSKPCAWRFGQSDRTGERGCHPDGCIIAGPDRFVSRLSPVTQKGDTAKAKYSVSYIHFIFTQGKECIHMRKNFLFFLTIGTLLLIGFPLFAQGYKKINAAGEANFIFASSPIEKGKEGQAKLKDTFTSGDKIYGRGYFPKALGKLTNGEEFFQWLYIDGKLAVRGGLENVDPSWDQMQVWLYNTDENDFSIMHDALKKLPKGSHKIKVCFVRTVYTGTKQDFNDKGKLVDIKQYKPVNYTVGEFTFVVQ
jgi:hypothetical protein